MAPPLRGSTGRLSGQTTAGRHRRKQQRTTHRLAHSPCQHPPLLCGGLPAQPGSACCCLRRQGSLGSRPLRVQHDRCWAQQGPGPPRPLLPLPCLAHSCLSGPAVQAQEDETNFNRQQAVAAAATAAAAAAAAAVAARAAAGEATDALPETVTFTCSCPWLAGAAWRRGRAAHTNLASGRLRGPKKCGE